MIFFAVELSDLLSFFIRFIKFSEINVSPVGSSEISNVELW